MRKIILSGMCFAFCFGGNASEPPQKKCCTVENSADNTGVACPVSKNAFYLGKGANVECSSILAAPGAPNIRTPSTEERLRYQFFQDVSAAILRQDRAFFNSIKQKSTQSTENSKALTTSKASESSSTAQDSFYLGKGANVECSSILAAPGAPKPLTREVLVNELEDAIRNKDREYFEDLFTQGEISRMYREDCQYLESIGESVACSEENWLDLRLARIFGTPNIEK